MHRTPALLTLITCSTALGACMGMSPLTESERQKMESLRHTQKEIPALCVIELEAQSGRVSSGQRSMQQSAMKWHMRTEHGSSGWETRRLHSEVLKEECKLKS